MAIFSKMGAIRTAAPFDQMIPYIMPDRTGASNLFDESVEITNLERYVRAKRREESLWDIAKVCGSTVSAIQRLNKLEREPEDNRLLLIPVI